MPVIHGIDMDVKDGEFIVIVRLRQVTLMRMVAGLESVTSGEILDDQVVISPPNAISRWCSRTTRSIRT